MCVCLEDSANIVFLHVFIALHHTIKILHHDIVMAPQMEYTNAENNRVQYSNG